MNTVTNIFPLRLSSDQDERVRRNLLPTAVMLTRGAVTGAQNLLKDHPVQASLEKGDVCVLRNSPDSEKAGLLLDFGRELHGLLSLTVAYIQSDNSRTRVLIRFGESATEALAPIGHKNSTNDHAVREHVYDIGQLSTTQTNESGFRFAYIQLEEPQATLEIQAVHMGFLYRDIPYLGSFHCDDPLLEQIWKTAAYTVHLNMQQYLWDGIKRDRLAWQGDLHTEIMTVYSVFGANSVVPKTLDFLRDLTQSGQWINGYSSYTLWWILVQAQWYRYTGDLEYLRAQKAFLKAQIPLVLSCIGENGAECLPPFRFLDWPNLSDPEATHAGLQGLIRIALRDAAYLLEILDELEQAALCAAAGEKAAGHIPDCGKSKQAAALLSLADLADAKLLNETVLSPGGAKGYSTFMGYYLLAAKAKAGDYSGALQDLRSYWGGMLDMGATSFWEDFDLSWMENATRIDQLPQPGKKDIHGDYGAHCYVNFRHSLCHGWASGPVPYLTEHVLGVQILEPGCKTLGLKPHLEGLNWASGTFPTPLGIVHIQHRKGPGGSIETQYSAPDGIQIIMD